MTPEEFIESYFHERRERLRTWQRYWLRFYKKFYKNPLGPRPAVSEHILVIERTAEKSTITVEETVFKVTKSKKYRYHLERNGDSWLIEKTEKQCFLCKGTGKKNQDRCPICNGCGWANCG